MLQNIRDNSQGWIAKTIIGVIIVLLALTGFDAILNYSSNAQHAAEVNGEAISKSQLEQAVSAQRTQLMQQLGRDFDASLLNENLLRQSALSGLIDRTLLLQSAKSAGFAYSETALDQVILQTPEFQVNGKFDAARFDQVLQRMGYNRIQFRQLLEQEMLIGQLRAGVAGTGFVTDREIESFSRLESQTRDFSLVKLPVDMTNLVIGEDEVKRYYEANPERFRSVEQVVVEYVQLDKAAFFDQITVAEDQVKELYEKQIANLAEQRRAAHILIEPKNGVTDEQAKAKLEELRTRLEQGEDFAALAKTFSQDPGSASEGGDLGYAGPGVYDPAFESALYGLAKEGDLSQPVRSEFGWHLIKLLGVQAPEVPSLDSMRAELVRQLKAEQVEQRFVEVGKQLEAAAYEAADLSQPAQELGLEVKAAAPFGRDGGEGIAANNQVVQAAFSTPVLEEGANSGIIELDPETAIVLRVKEHRKPEVLPLEQVHETIIAQLRREKASEQVRAKGEALLAQLRSGAVQAAVSWQSVEAATRNQEGIEPVLLQQVFRMARPADSQTPSYAGLLLPGGEYAVLRLDGVNEPTKALSAEEKQSYRRFLASRSGQQAFQAYLDKLRADAKIKQF